MPVIRANTKPLLWVSDNRRGCNRPIMAMAAEATRQGTARRRVMALPAQHNKLGPHIESRPARRSRRRKNRLQACAQHCAVAKPPLGPTGPGPCRGSRALAWQGRIDHPETIRLACTCCLKSFGTAERKPCASLPDPSRGQSVARAPSGNTNLRVVQPWWFRATATCRWTAGDALTGDRAGQRLPFLAERRCRPAQARPRSLPGQSRETASGVRLPTAVRRRGAFPTIVEDIGATACPLRPSKCPRINEMIRRDGELIDFTQSERNNR
jgi:hypothetical protein